MTFGGERNMASEACVLLRYLWTSGGGSGLPEIMRMGMRYSKPVVLGMVAGLDIRMTVRLRCYQLNCTSASCTDIFHVWRVI